MAAGQKRYLTVAAAARRAGVSSRTVLNWIAAGKLQAHKLPSGRFRIHTDVLRVYLAERTGAAGSIVPQQDPLRMGLCWFTHGAGSGHRCHECTVYRIQSMHCFVAREEFGDDAVGCPEQCSDCAMFRDVYRSISRDLEIHPEPCGVGRGTAILGLNSALEQLVEWESAELIGRAWTVVVPEAEYHNVLEAGRRFRERWTSPRARIRSAIVTRAGAEMAVEMEFSWYKRLWGALALKILPLE